MKRRSILRKKGISPLIATVLIIGLTIALAAIIMNWGRDLFTTVTEDTEAQLREQQKCTSELEFVISKVNCSSNTITIDNRGIAEIKGLRIRIFSGDEVIVANANKETNNNTFPIGSGYIKNVNLTAANPDADLTEDTTKIDIIATIAGLEGKADILCSKFPKPYSAPCS